jgi:hypothetical protein
VILLPVVLLLHAAQAPPISAPSAAADAGDPPARVARVSYLDGAVSFQRSGASGWSEATLNYTVTTGDRLYTDSGSRAELQVGPFAVRLADATDLTITSLTDQFMQLGLAQGTIRISVYRLAADDSIEVDTPNGSLTLLQPGEYRVDIFPRNNATLVTVDRGSLEIGAAGAAETVAGGQAVQLTGTNPIQLSNVTPAGVDDFDRWSQDRDGRLPSSPSARYVSRDIPGYEDLDDAGRWQEDQQYGPVWYPTTVAPGWVPYRSGHWAWVDPWGWTWVEEERWGFAPFHYGRWVYVGSAWGWLPGPVVEQPCYAPALVVFVQGSHFRDADDQAWFPLGPREPFYPSYHHDERYRRRVNDTNIRNAGPPPDINTVHFANRSATTVVTGATFRGGQNVGRHLVPTTPDRVATARITPHATATPTAGAARGGRPAPSPPTIARPLIRVGTPLRVQQPAPATEPRPAASPQPLIRKNPAPPPQPLVRSTPPPGNGAGAEPQRRPPPLVARTPPPPAAVPLPTRQQAMQAHPGRPLEPQQVDNLRAGRPAGPNRDREVPPHPAPAPRAAPAPRPQASPAPKKPGN